jgi:hypothetical protein
MLSDPHAENLPLSRRIVITMSLTSSINLNEALAGTMGGNAHYDRAQYQIGRGGGVA